jgi:hypothetical protein
MIDQPASGIVVRFLDGQDTDALSNFYTEVLTPSFRPAELVDADALLEAVRSGRTLVSVAVGSDGTVLGGMVADWHQDSRVLLLSYLAVRPCSRSQGVGQTLIGTTGPVWLAQLAPLVALAEVEDPRYFPGTEYGDAVARLQLYTRYGVRMLPVPYMQPEVRPGHGRVRHLLLVVFFVDDAACPAPGRVDGDIVERFVERYFSTVEGPARDDDVELARLRAACRQPGGLPLQHVDDLIAEAGAHRAATDCALRGSDDALLA